MHAVAESYYVPQNFQTSIWNMNEWLTEVGTYPTSSYLVDSYIRSTKAFHNIDESIYNEICQKICYHIGQFFFILLYKCVSMYILMCIVQSWLQSNRKKNYNLWPICTTAKYAINNSTSYFQDSDQNIWIFDENVPC